MDDELIKLLLIFQTIKEVIFSPVSEIHFNTEQKQDKTNKGGDEMCRFQSCCYNGSPLLHIRLWQCEVTPCFHLLMMISHSWIGGEEILSLRFRVPRKDFKVSMVLKKIVE